MCGIIGYVGDEQRAMEVILDGLSKLEYRGYDSAGIALKEKDEIISNLANELSTLKQIKTTQKATTEPRNLRHSDK